MIWHSFSDFWAMGGYAVYVWGSFGMTAALVWAEIAWAKQARRKLVQNIQAERASVAVNATDWR